MFCWDKPVDPVDNHNAAASDEEEDDDVVEVVEKKQKLIFEEYMVYMYSDNSSLLVSPIVKKQKTTSYFKEYLRLRRLFRNRLFKISTDGEDDDDINVEEITKEYDLSKARVTGKLKFKYGEYFSQLDDITENLKAMSCFILPVMKDEVQVVINTDYVDDVDENENPNVHHFENLQACAEWLCA